MRTHVTAVVRACFAALDPERAVISVTTCLADLDSCTDCQQGGLLQLGSRWSSQPPARPDAVRLECRSHLVFSARQSERITPLLQELHWLRVPERVTFRLSVVAYRCLHGTAPAYLADSLLACSEHLTWTLDIVCTLLTQPCWWYRPPDVHHSVTVPSSGFGTCMKQPAVVCQ